MNGKVVVISLLLFTVIFSILLYYFQVFAFYKRVDNISSLRINDRNIDIQDYRGIDSSSSGLKLRGCFLADPTDFEGLPRLKKATPLSAPFWFECFDHEELQLAINEGRLHTFMAEENEKDGIDRIAAIFPDGRGFQWRQLNSKFVD